MKRFGMFLAPLALLLPVSVAPVAASAESTASFAGYGISSLSPLPPPSAAWQAPVWRQVRIEQHWSIRITPGTPSRPSSVVEEIEEEERVERVESRKIGKCLPISSIATLEAGDDNELLLFLRDQRIIGATLEKHCSARDFYAGFLVRNADGAICAGRDTLQSRSGANCKLKGLHELVAAGDRRFP